MTDADELAANDLRDIFENENISRMILMVDQNVPRPIPLNAETHQRAEIIPVRERIGKFFLQRTDMQAGKKIRSGLFVPDEGLRIEPGGEKESCPALRVIISSLQGEAHTENTVGICRHAELFKSFVKRSLF